MDWGWQEIFGLTYLISIAIVLLFINIRWTIGFWRDGTFPKDIKPAPKIFIILLWQIKRIRNKHSTKCKQNHH